MAALSESARGSGAGLPCEIVAILLASPDWATHEERLGGLLVSRSLAELRSTLSTLGNVVRVPRAKREIVHLLFERRADLSAALELERAAAAALSPAVSSAAPAAATSSPALAPPSAVTSAPLAVFPPAALRAVHRLWRSPRLFPCCLWVCPRRSSRALPRRFFRPRRSSVLRLLQCLRLWLLLLGGRR